MKRRGSLDFLKVIATVFILFHHYQQVMGVKYPSGINFDFGSFYWGSMVELFFIISGFVMLPWCRKISENAPGSDLKSFLFRRYRRFIPMLAVTAVCYELMCFVIMRFVPQLADQFINLSIWGTLCDILCIQSGWCMRNTMINNPTWYICVLMLCYVLFWLITAFCREKNIKPRYGYLFMILLGFSLRISGAALPFFNDSAARGYIAFFLGLLLAMAEDKYELHGVGRSAFYLLFAVIIILAPDTEKTFSISYLFFPLIVLLFTSESVEKLFSAKLWETLGAIQFHAFLWHLTVIECARVIMALTGAPVGKRLYMFITVLLSELIGVLSYFLLDKSADRLFLAILPKEKKA